MCLSHLSSPSSFSLTGCYTQPVFPSFCCESSLWNGNQDWVSPSFQTSERACASDVFLRSWSAAKPYKWSRERERESRGRRERQNIGGRGGVGQKKMKGKRMTNEQGKEAASMGLIQKHSDPVFIVLYPSPAQSTLLFCVFCWATTPCFWLKISW